MDSSVVVLYRKRETCPIYPKLNHAFQILGIEPRLVLSDEALRDLFREAGKQVHPDAGGGEGEFAALRDRPHFRKQIHQCRLDAAADFSGCAAKFQPAHQSA